MKWSLNLGTVAGIRIKIHWTFLFIVLYVFYSNYRQSGSLETGIWGVLFILAVFACVTLHELGHATMGKRFGVRTRKITLLPIGGVASMENIPEKPGHEFWIAIAGPLVNVGIAVLLYLLFAGQIVESYTRLQELTLSLARGGSEQLSESAHQALAIGPHNFIFYLFFVNLMLVLFNIIPAFPMDGGRVLRALLAMRMNRARATQIAATVGQVFAFLFIIWGFYSDPFLIFIGLFVFLGAYSENMMIQQTEALRGHRVKEVMHSAYVVLPPEARIKDAVDYLLQGHYSDFIVMDDQDRIVGLLSKPRLINALKTKSGEEPVADILVRDFETLHPNEKLSKIYPGILGNEAGFYPVLEQGRLLGVVDKDSVDHFLIQQSSLN